MSKFVTRIGLLPASALTLALSLALGASPALAVCSPPAAIGVTATCSGDTLNQDGANGYGTGSLDTDISLTVLQGATVTGTANGISLGNNLTAVNYGTITGLTGDGFQTFDNLISLTNWGTIIGADDGVEVTYIHSLTNYGTITGSNDGVRAVNLFSLTNAGLIQGRGFAIREFIGVNTTLTLLPGSVIIGGIDLGGGVNTLNVGNGLSIANTFFEGAGSNVPVIGTTSGAPFAVSGNQVAVVDPTSLAAQQVGFVDLTGGIFSTVENRLSGLRNGSVAGVTTTRPMAVG